MSQQVTTQSSGLPAERKSFPKIDAVFDALEHIIERTEGLVWKAKYLLFGLGFLLFLIYELAHFGKYLLAQWSG
jgi:hypothetical protein